MLFESGPSRIPLSTWYYLGTVGALLWLQNMIASTRMPTHFKRILSIPLLTTDLFFPVFFMDASGSWNLLGATIPFMGFLRFVDLIWVAPMVQGTEPYATIAYLRNEFWTCLRIQPEKKKQEDISMIKNRRFYHIIPHFLLHALVSDMIGAWFMTFSQKDIMTMYHDQPLYFFGFFLMALVAMNSGFTANGYIMQLIYVVLFEKGSYCKAQWRRLMEFPYCATSLGDIWSVRWHQALKSTWLNLPFTEVRILTERVCSKLGIKSGKRLGIMAAALSVFMISGVLHEYLVYVNVGYTDYKLFRGEEMCFFTIHGIAVMLEKLVSRNFKGQTWTTRPAVMILRRIWTLGFACYTFPLFLRGFMHWDSWHAGAFFPYQEHMLNSMRHIPGFQHLCGSLY